MASGFTNTVLMNVLNALLAGATFTASVTGINVRLMTATGSSTSAGTELTTGGGYTAAPGNASNNTQFGTWTTGNASYSAPNCTSANTTPATQWTNMPACTITGAELWDRNSTPARKMWADLTGGSKTVNAGDTFSFAIGALVGQIAG